MRQRPLGHSSGDLLLQAVAERLGAVVRAADTACRYGGDEFAILLPELDHPGMVSAVSAKIRLRLGEPYIIDGYRIHMTVSVGTAVYPADGQTCDDLMNRADVAMYLAKGMGQDVSIIALPDTPHLGSRCRHRMHPRTRARCRIAVSPLRMS